jgi:hypothetical protein
MHSQSLYAFLFLAMASPILAQDDAKHHRAVYAETNDNLKSYKRVKTVFRDGELEFELESWWDKDKVRRIDSKVPGEDGDGSEEYYIEDGKLLFAFRYYRAMSAEEGAKRVLVEDRFYFKDGAMFKWIGTDKKLVPKEDEVFEIERERLTTNLASFLSALEQKMAPVGAVIQTVGTFKGIEQGDYGHWNMADSEGKEISFFILQPDESVDKALADPDAFVGKKCTVKWKKSKEDIPEAGGVIEVEQILSVEWSAEK